MSEVGVVRILVVEDDPMQRNGLKDLLSLEGYAVETAEDAFRAMKLLEEEHYDLVISDVHLPGNGFSLLSWSRERYPDLPIILMTADSQAGYPERARSAGAFEYLEKPVFGDRLFESVEMALSA